MQAIDGLDHVLVGVADLEAARQNWARLGFSVTPRGRHFGWGTANYCIMFERDYIELLGIVDASLFTNGLDRFLAERGEGLLGLAFASSDAERSQAELQRRAIASEGPKPLSRLLELPQGDVEPKFSLVFPAPEAVPGWRAFICQQLTRNLVWRDEWTAHANGAFALREVIALHDDPASLAPAYRRLFDEATVRLEAGVLRVACGSCELIFRQRQGQEKAGPSGFTLAVRDLAQTLEALDSVDLSFTTRGHRLEVEADLATGVALTFLEER